MRFELTILGSGSALPTSDRNTTAQALNVLERFFLIDCGEGTQHQLRKNKVSFNHINHIMISHLHGDHFFGLFGLISTMALVGRERALNIYGPPELENLLHTILKPQFEKPPFPLNFKPLKTDDPEVIFEDKVMKVYSFGLRHSVPVWGFKFEEKPRPRKMRADKIKEYEISIPEIIQVKDGDNILRNGKTIPNKELTTDPLPPRSYVFMTDTLLTRKHIPIINNVDLLYHEATFLEEDLKLARKTMHATAKQAAQLAIDASVKYLFIGHFSTRYHGVDRFELEAKQVFNKTLNACDGDVIRWPDNNHECFLLLRNQESRKLLF